MEKIKAFECHAVLDFRELMWYTNLKYRNISCVFNPEKDKR